MRDLTEPSEAALGYAARGWRVLPLHWITREGRCSCKRECGAEGKHPLIANGLTGASVVADEIRAWWTQWPRANVGVATSDALAVVDVDPARGGEDGLAACVARLGPIGPTLTVRTGSGGRHLYVATSAPLTNSVDRLARGVDVRGAGGYVVAPPSIHLSGARYAWEGDTDEIAPLPPAWAEAAARRPRREPRASAAIGRTDPRSLAQAERYLRERAPVSIQGQGGSTACMSVMATLRTMGVADVEDALAILGPWNARCQPPWEIEGPQGLRRKYLESEAPIGEPPRQRVQAHDVIAEARGGLEPVAPRITGGGSYDCGKDGRPRPTLSNCCTAFRAESAWMDRLRHNEMTRSPELDGTTVDDAVLGRIRETLEREYRIIAPKQIVRDALVVVAREHVYHPVREYLRSLRWDRTPRIARVPSEILHAEDSQLARAIMRCTLVGAAARALSPGIKHDLVCVLCGEQGFRKSALWSALADPWFADSGLDLQNKDSYQLVHSAWLYEWGEIDALTTRTHSGRIKGFCSSSVDTYRAPYDATVNRHPRSGAIVASVNPTTWQYDPTGARRFPVIVVRARVEEMRARAWRDQLWAEACSLYERYLVDLAGPAQGDPDRVPDAYRWWLSDTDDATRATEAELHAPDDPWSLAVADLPDEVTILDAMRRIGLETALQTPASTQRVVTLLRTHGYTPVRRKSGRVWVRTTQ